MQYKVELKVGDPLYKNGIEVVIRLSDLPTNLDAISIESAIRSLKDVLKPYIIEEK